MTAPADDVIGLYERHAARWAADRARMPWHDRAWHERFAAALGVGASVLDLGCGSGVPVAAFLVDRGHSVTGVDASAAMIEMCRARLPGQAWHVADMRTVSLERRFDGILAWDSFFHLGHEDQRAMFPIFAAHAGEGTVLMLNTGPAHGEAIGAYQGDPLYHASLAGAEYAFLLQQAGFEVIAHVPSDPHAGGRTVWLARRQLRD